MLPNPQSLIQKIPNKLTCNAFPKPNDLKPRAIYPIEMYTSILEGIFIGALEKALSLSVFPITMDLSQ